MTKIRVYELAKELNMTNKELVEILKTIDIDVKNHMSSLNDQEVKILRKKVEDTKQADNNKPLKNNENKQEKGNTNKQQPNPVENAVAHTKHSGKKNNKKKHKKHSRDNGDRYDMGKDKQINNLTFPEKLTVQELANMLDKSSGEIIKTLMALGIMATINQEID
ncbi:MAG: translation initiation factor IF-2 N-terminal domain-containing protein, partial [Bacillota bacterium]|nr:translation initiation factor IF-2 N-terminal domain-containing protein [Bacillota bacterium]